MEKKDNKKEFEQKFDYAQMHGKSVKNEFIR